MSSVTGALEGGQRVEHLVGVVRQLAAARTLEEIVDTVRHAARELSGADGATFVLRDGDRCRYVDEDAIEPLWKGRSFPLESCVSGWAMLNRLPVVIEDIYRDDRVPHDAYRPTFVRSLVMVPIRTEQPLGAIGAYWATARRATPSEVAALQALADSTSVAMENVRLYNELEARVAARTAELERANDELHQLTAAVAHDIRSPLFAVQGYTQLLSKYASDGMSDDARVAADGVRRSVDNLSGFVTELLEYLVTGHRETASEPVSLDDLFAEVAERVSGEVGARNASVRLATSGTVCGDRALLGRALQNLVANAIAYAPADRDPEVVVALVPDGDHVVVTVSDNGDGIPPADRDRLFAPFQRGTARTDRPGSGLGLALCRRIAEQHGGTITVRDSAAGGAEFVLRLPDHAP